MNPAATLAGWLQLLGLLGCEVAVVVSVAALLQRCTKSALWRRTILQVATLALLALVACELTGLSRSVVGWATPKPKPRWTHSIQLAAESRPAEAVTEPLFTQTTEPVMAVAAPMNFSKPLPQPTLIWWPGMVWLSGTVLVAGWAVLARLWFVLCGRRRRVVNDGLWSAQVQSLAQRLRIRRRIRLTESSDLSGPIAFGIFRPAISLPEGFRKKFTEAQQDAMLIHELAHLAAHDPLWYWLADIVTALLWWHPLAWWLRRQLHAASEITADEASLLIRNGPEVLAECLVELGRRLTQPQSAGWLGIEGSGFRSGLGRRVKRLVTLRGQSWKPLGRINAWLAKTIGPLALVALVLASTAGTQPRHHAKSDTPSQAFRQSVFGLALFAVLPDEPVSKEGETSQSAVSEILLQAKAHWETNNLVQAEAKVNEALKLDPNNQAAKKCFLLVQKLRDLDLGDEVSSFITRSAKSPAEAESMLKELIKIDPQNSRAFYELSLLQLLPLLSFTNQDLGLSKPESVLTNEPPSKDSLLHPTNPPKEVSPGALATNSAMKRMQLNDILFHPTLPPKAVVDGTSETNSASRSNATRSDYGVVITSKHPEPSSPQTLHTGWFHIDPEMWGLQIETNQHWAQRINSIARELFTAAGVDFGTEKSLFFKDRTGIMMVRATLGDFQIIEQVISSLELQRPSHAEQQFPNDFGPVLPIETFLGVLGTNAGSPGNEGGRKALVSKFDSIVLDEVVFSGEPLTEFVENLNAQVWAQYPQSRGERLITMRGNPTYDLMKVIVRAHAPLKNVRLREILNVLAESASPPISYKVEGDMAFISAKYPEPVSNAAPVSLHTRWFKIDPDTFLKNLRSVTPYDFGNGERSETFGSAKDVSRPDADRQTYTSKVPSVNDALRDFFTAAGVDFGPRLDATPSKERKPARVSGERTVAVTTPAPGNEKSLSLFGHERPFSPPARAPLRTEEFQLAVRATLQDLEIIEKAVQKLNSGPPQLTIEVKVAEIAQDDNKALGFDWYFGNVNIYTGSNGPVNGLPLKSSGAFPESTSTNGPLADGKTPVMNGVPGSMTGILTDPQYRVVIRALEQRPGVDLLTMPKLQTLSGRQAQLKAVDVKNIVTGLATNLTPGAGVAPLETVTTSHELGPAIDVFPTVSPDGYSIQLAVNFVINEFLGYDSAKQEKVTIRRSDGKEFSIVKPRPLFRNCQVAATATIWDGQTLVIGGDSITNVQRIEQKVPVLGSLPLLGRLFRSETSKPVKKNRVLFMTPRLIDPASNPIHTDQELQALAEKTPPQQPKTGGTK